LRLADPDRWRRLLGGLQRDVTVEFGVARQMDLAHASRAERREDFKGTEPAYRGSMPREGRLSPAVGQFRDVLLLLNRLKTEGVIHDYAIGGAVAVSLWAEPVAIQDLDVIVTVAGDAHPLDPLRPLLEWFDRHGLAFEGAHVVIAGVPVQFLVAWSPLVQEAVATAAETAYDPADPPSNTKAQWHAQQRRLPPREKIRILIELQRREVESNGIRKSLGRPAVEMKPWNTQA
jgi:hypothetical protein